MDSQHPFLADYPLNDVVSQYESPAIRLYCRARSYILRNRILAEIGQYLPRSGDIAEMGCGFGLFALCFAMRLPGCRFEGCDLSEGRIREARSVAAKLDVENVRFSCEDAQSFARDMKQQDAIYLFDLVHHLPPDEVDPFLERLWSALKPGGTLIIKEVSNRPWHKMAFTWTLDVLMTLGERPHYLPPDYFVSRFDRPGSTITVHHLDDYLPYPHILYIVRKQALS